MSNRALAHSIHIYNANDPGIVLGGLVLTNGITNADFYVMVEIIFLFNQDYTLHHESGITVGRNGHPLQPGKYFIVTGGSIILSALSAAVGFWARLGAAHVFPIAHKRQWVEHNYNRWMSIRPESGESKKSVQNGILRKSDIHHLFDNYMVSINPDDNYMIICFMYNGTDIAGTYLDKKLLEDPRRPVDQLLRWHFRQAVLADVRGQGEPACDSDSPPGSDMLGEIVSGPNAGERMEFELFSRLVE
ncbi:hypothetical protein HOY82DRAFT_595284 [Tuber indicum]|nr:hypothetical protein HOY82DRAFT_595284 [Tuber indicum]